MFYLLIEPVWNRNQHHNHSTLQSYYSFNRTSMESKLFLRLVTGGAPRDICLLIEPVWNRNLYDEFPLAKPKLLIEPVWNRNRRSGVTWNHIPTSSFNRTSMESKREYRTPFKIRHPPFNRTSMESKPKRQRANPRR